MAWGLARGVETGFCVSGDEETTGRSYAGAFFAAITGCAALFALGGALAGWGLCYSQSLDLDYLNAEIDVLKEEVRVLGNEAALKEALSQQLYRLEQAQVERR